MIVLEAIEAFGKVSDKCKELASDNNAVNKLAYLLRKISVIIVFIVLLSQCWDFSYYVDGKMIPPLRDDVSLFLHKYTFGLFLAWIIYDVVDTGIYCVLILLELKFKVVLIPLWDTITNTIKLLASCDLLLYSFDLVIESCNGNDILIKDNEIYWLTTLYLAYVFVNWVYNKHKHKQRLRNTSYTDYFDMDGNRIANEDKVIYNGKLYEIFCTSDLAKIKAFPSKNGIWLVDKISRLTTISLEDAAKDEKGKLKVYRPGMGERK